MEYIDLINTLHNTNIIFLRRSKKLVSVVKIRRWSDFKREGVVKVMYLLRGTLGADISKINTGDAIHHNSVLALMTLSGERWSLFVSIAFAVSNRPLNGWLVLPTLWACKVNKSHCLKGTVYLTFDDGMCVCMRAGEKERDRFESPLSATQAHRPVNLNPGGSMH